MCVQEDIAYVEKKRVLWQKKLQSIPPILRDIYTEEVSCIIRNCHLIHAYDHLWLVIVNDKITVC